MNGRKRGVLHVLAFFEPGKSTKIGGAKLRKLAEE